MNQKSFFGVPKNDWAWLLFLASWRLFISGRHGLGVDEAHYVLYGLRLDWSYFDHPPLVGWVQGFFLALLGRHEWAARMPAILSGLISSILAFRLSQKISGSKTIARWATLGLNAAFLPAALWIMLVPDTLLLILALWLVEVTARIIENNKNSDWLWLGVCLGLCGLTKYTAIFFVFSLFGIVTTEKAWKKLSAIKVIPAVVLAGVIVSPVLFWNHSHHWISFSYQQNHVLGSQHLNFEKFFTFLITQFVAFSPFLIVVAVLGFTRQWKKLDLRSRLVLWLSLPTLLFFFYSSLRDEVLPHWTLISWGLLIPVGVTLALMSAQVNLIKRLVIASTVVTVFVMLELTFVFIKFPPFQSPYADLLGWPKVHDDVGQILSREVPGTFSIAVPNWTLGSRASYYLNDLAPVYVLDDRFDQFDLWEGGPPRTPNILVLNWRGFDLRASEIRKCSSYVPVGHDTFLVNGSPVNSVKLFWCRGYKVAPSTTHENN